MVRVGPLIYVLAYREFNTQEHDRLYYAQVITQHLYVKNMDLSFDLKRTFLSKSCQWTAHSTGPGENHSVSDVQLCTIMLRMGFVETFVILLSSHQLSTVMENSHIWKSIKADPNALDCFHGYPRQKQSSNAVFISLFCFVFGRQVAGNTVREKQTVQWSWQGSKKHYKTVGCYDDVILFAENNKLYCRLTKLFCVCFIWWYLTILVIEKALNWLC